MPSLEKPPGAHPHASDPSSRHFVRDHPQRTRNSSKLFNISSSSVKTYEQAARAVGPFATLAVSDPSFPRVDFVFASSAFTFASSPSPHDDWLVHAAMCVPNFAFAVALTSELGAVAIPKSYRQALNSPHADYWREAIAKELGGLLQLRTWKLVPITSMPSGANLMHCHYVFTVKRKADGSIEKFKARLVADGNTQKYGIDFDRVFSTVVKTQTLRLVLVIAVARDYNLTSIDIRQAYLQAELDTELYMRAPPGVPSSSNGVQLVCKLQRSLYGLKQAGREWAALFSSFLLSWGFVRSAIDTCLYTYVAGAALLWVVIWVDDAVIVDSDTALRTRFVSDLSKRFPTEDKGDLTWILNISITRDRRARTLSMSQELYIADLVEKHAPSIAAGQGRTYDTPFAEGLVFSSDDRPTVGSPEHAAMDAQRPSYMSIVGGLLWLANMTMPELSYPASQLARFLTNPGPQHVQAAMRVLAYLHSARARTLMFAPNSQRGFEVLVDSNWSTRFSCSGAMYFFHGCLFYWFSKMQHSVSLSSAEAEYFGAMLATRDLLFLRDVLVDLGVTLDGPTPLYSDSKSAVDMAFDPIAFKNTKHIMRAAEFLRDLVRKGAVHPMHIAGVLMLADLLTKAVSRPVFLDLMKLLAAFARDAPVSSVVPSSSPPVSPPLSPPPSPPASEAGDESLSESESEFDGVEDAPEDVAPYVAPFPQALPEVPPAPARIDSYFRENTLGSGFRARLMPP